MKRMNFPRRRAQRRLEAEARAAAYQRLSMGQKLAQMGRKARLKWEKRHA